MPYRFIVGRFTKTFLVVKYYSFGMHVWDIVKDYGALGKKVHIQPANMNFQPSLVELT